MAAESRSPSDAAGPAPELEGGWAPLSGWRLLRVTGADRVRFLNSQVTADVRGLAVGRTVLAALLDASARLVAFFFVHRREGDLLLVAPPGTSESARDALAERVVADDVSVEEPPQRPLRLALGPAAMPARTALPPDELLPLAAYGEHGFITWGDGTLGLPELAPDELEARRILSGLPRWGEEVEAGTLVTETALMATAVSLTKGCYVGQETVAKVASGRGPAHAPAILCCGGHPAEPQDLAGHELVVDEGRPAQVLAACRWRGELMLALRLHREQRVSGRRLAGRVGDLELAGTVALLPLLEPPAPEEVARRLHETAVARFTGDDEVGAVRLLEAALAICPAFPDAAESLGVILGRQGRYEEAVALMHRLLEADPESVMAHTNLSLFYNRLGRIEDAEREQAEAAAASFRVQQGVRARAEAEREREHAEREDAGRRRALLEQVLELDPDDALANLGLAELLLDEGAAAAARERAERVLAQDPRASNAHLVRARALEELGETAAAREGYRRGIEVAAARGDLMTANRMQERLSALTAGAPSEVG